VKAFKKTALGETEENTVGIKGRKFCWELVLGVDYPALRSPKWVV